MQELVWVTRDGRHYRICDMSTTHITNAIRLIERRWPWRRRYYERLKLELEIRSMDRSSHR